MFPKFLRVVTAKWNTKLEGFNKTTTFWKKVPLVKDRWQLEVIAEALGFSYEVVFASDGQGFGERLPNGSWTKALGMIQRGEADLLFGPLGLTEERQEAFHVSYPFAVDEVTFITKKHEPVFNTDVFFHPFSIQVWLSIIACLCFVPFVFQCLLRKKYSSMNLFTSTLGSLVGQGIGIAPQRVREYLVLACWIIGSSLLYYFYAAVLLSFLTFPSMEGIRTIKDLANGIQGGKYHCETYEAAIYADVLSGQQNSELQVIGNELQQSEGFDYFIWCLEFPYDRKPAFVGVRSEFLPYKDFYFISDENFLSSFVAFATHKEFCCGPELDKEMHNLWASGILEKLSAQNSFEDFLMNLSWYGENWAIPTSETQLTMAQLKGPFIFLIVSHSLAFFIFLVEVCIGKLKSH